MTTSRHLTPAEVVVHARGRVRPTDLAYARDKIARLGRLAPQGVLFAKVDLLVREDGKPDRRALAKAELDVSGQMVRANARADTTRVAVDRLDERLRERLERVRDRRSARRLRHREADQWRHGDPATARPPYFARPSEERGIVRRKTFAVDEVAVEEAVGDLEALDHDFFLFRNADTHEDNVLRRVATEQYELLSPAGAAVAGPNGSRQIEPSSRTVSRMTVRDALELLDLGDEPFVFFLDVTTGRGQVVYRRYDGHYGLVTSTDPVRNGDGWEV